MGLFDWRGILSDVDIVVLWSGVRRSRPPLPPY